MMHQASNQAALRRVHVFLGFTAGHFVLQRFQLRQNRFQLLHLRGGHLRLSPWRVAYGEGVRAKFIYSNIKYMLRVTFFRHTVG